MADLAVWQRTIVDEEGNVVPGAEVEVRREEDDSLATLYADRAGETPLANPLAADMSGFVRFFAQGDAYTITAVGAGSTRTWRFDPTGRLQEFDRISEALVADDAADLVAARSNLGEFATVADVESANIPPVLDSIRINGYSDPGDGGGALYVEGAEGPGAIQSGDGRWWIPDIPLGFTFSSVAEMKAAAFLTLGSKVRTLGYYEPGDGGGSTYEVVAGGTGTDDGGTYLDHSNPNIQLRALFPKSVSVAQYGAIPGIFDGDHTPQFQAALDNSGRRIITIPFPATADSSGMAKWYHLTNIIVPADKVLLGDDIHANGKTMGDVNWASELSRRVVVKATGPVNTPVITILNRAAVLGFRMVDTRQKRSVATSDEPWNETQVAIRLGADPAVYFSNANNTGQTIESITFLGFNTFVDQWTNDRTATPQSIGNLTLRGLNGTPHKVAVDIARMSDISRAYDCQWVAHSVLTSGWAQGDTQLYRYNLAKSSTGWRLGRADGFKLFGCQGLGLRYWVHSYRDAWPGDTNRGGGFHMDSCPADVVGIGYKFSRDGDNGIGCTIRGGHVLAVVNLGDEENTYFQFDGTIHHMQVAAFGIGCHTATVGRSNPNPQSHAFYGPDSVKPPTYVVDFLNGASNINLDLVGSTVESYNQELVDWSKVADGNRVSFVSCHNRDGVPVNKRTISDGADPLAGFEYIVSGTGESVIRWKNQNNDTLAFYRVTPPGGTMIQSTSGTRLFANYGKIDQGSVSVSSNNANFVPDADGVQLLGSAAYRWNQVYASTGTIATSDAREKTPVRLLSEAEERVAKRLSRLPGIYQWLSAIAEKGEENARLHMGVMAQDVKAAFEAEGLDGFRYGVLCWDEWAAEDAELDGEGIVLAPAREAGDRYGVRYDELAQWQAAGWNARLAALEGIDD